LFFLRLQSTEQDLFDAGRTGHLKLFLESGVKGRILDFDIHVLNLQKGIELSFSSYLRQRKRQEKGGGRYSIDKSSELQ